VGFDLWEGWGVWGADRVVVNSGFTKGVVEEVWPGVGRERGVGVVYPCVNTKEISESGTEAGTTLWKDKKVLLSINRFERKKDVGLAIRAFAGLTSEERQGVRLVIAGSCRRFRSITSKVTVVDKYRWLRHPTTRKRNLPPRARIPRRLPRPQPRHRQNPRLRPQHPPKHNHPLPPLRPRPAQILPPKRSPTPHLHPLKRAFRHRPPRSHASRRPRARRQQRRSARDRHRCRDRVVALGGEGRSVDGCDAGSAA